MSYPSPETLTLPDGRELEYWVTGAGDDLLVFHVGTPSAGIPLPNITSAATERGMRVVSYSRPGFGTSTRLPKRTVADEAGHAGALADHLGDDRFFVMGWSGGGSFALACAALLPHRVRSCAVVAGLSPYTEVGDEWFTGMADTDVEEFRMIEAADSRDEILPIFEDSIPYIESLTPESLIETSKEEKDRAAFRAAPEVAEALAAQFERAIANGPEAWMDEVVAYFGPWGFDVHDISVPVTILHGDADLHVDVFHARWLAQHIPGARAHILPGEGHISIAVPATRIIDALVETDSGIRV